MYYMKIQEAKCKMSSRVLISSITDVEYFYQLPVTAWRSFMIIQCTYVVYPRLEIQVWRCIWFCSFQWCFAKGMPSGTQSQRPSGGVLCFFGRFFGVDGIFLAAASNGSAIDCIRTSATHFAGVPPDSQRLSGEEPWYLLHVEEPPVYQCVVWVEPKKFNLVI